MADIKIFGTFHNVTGEPVAKAHEIRDEILGKTQAEINQTIQLENVTSAAELWGDAPEPAVLVAEVFTTNDGTDNHPSPGVLYTSLYVKFYEAITPTIGAEDEEEEIYNYYADGLESLNVTAVNTETDGVAIDVRCGVDFVKEVLRSTPSAPTATIPANTYVEVTYDGPEQGEGTIFVGYTKFYSDGAMSDYVANA